ncbi:molybdopterin-guanine dinucleotide biosynthesis protein A [Vibrio azureus]|uniref:CPXCG motif-containing cysteine-rich protein n=2 Tax=Vibrio harveyi group TaxID=717610 RepID=U3AMX3_9VIBR|nr:MULTISPECIES: CPXCG motif-containing cysteine-rich protein [Vibrio harveyi group]AUI86092.1 molybdopterin-guanine dinucleotide biosynthesis protein A [Vibrio azureus]PNQ53947.1 CPXCG motif-containing cysteine-rich protein [Vibrio agarivorans]GAD74647.1 hypothetical protein VAZ01S_013_00540 [Vibrio azureus NBRC 104587]GEM74555.1 hypothetical protein VSA01S_06670 [Vibrio sagamiensis NBRC 104589]
MEKYTERHIHCPHCGQSIRVSLDASNGDQELYDDCPACCHTIHLNLKVDELHEKIDLFIDDEID